MVNHTHVHLFLLKGFITPPVIHVTVSPLHSSTLLFHSFLFSSTFSFLNRIVTLILFAVEGQMICSGLSKVSSSPLTQPKESQSARSSLVTIDSGPTKLTSKRIAPCSPSGWIHFYFQGLPLCYVVMIRKKCNVCS